MKNVVFLIDQVIRRLIIDLFGEMEVCITRK